MIKITNLNFQNQTIENIEVDSEDVHNVELKLTKTIFKIVVVKEDKIIKKQIKKKDISNEVVDVVMDEPVMEKNEKENDEEVEPVMEEVHDEIEKVVDPVMDEIHEEIEEVVEPVMEEFHEEIEEVVEPVTLGKMKELLKEHIPKPNTQVQVPVPCTISGPKHSLRKCNDMMMMIYSTDVSFLA
jgi:predicted transcriptional regulator